MRDWIENRLTEIGKKKAGLARHLGLPFARVSEMIKGTRKLQTNEITAFAQYMNLSPDKVVQLFSMGEADMEVESLAAGNDNFSEITTPLPHDTGVPLISWISAGQLAQTASLDDFDSVSYAYAPDLDPNGDWIALRVDGRSMDKISPHDSIIFVNRNERALVPNGCYVIGDGNGGATYKRFRPPNIFEAVSTKADDYPPITFPEGQEPDIIGRVRKSILTM